MTMGVRLNYRPEIGGGVGFDTESSENRRRILFSPLNFQRTLTTTIVFFNRWQIFFEHFSDCIVHVAVAISGHSD
jgi:hypothetical protein